MTLSQPSKRTPREIESEWFAKVYAGDGQPQLTFRAVLIGMLLGVVMSFSNLYVGLKTGWGLGVVVTAVILSYAVFKIVPTNWMQAPSFLPLFDRHRDRHVSLLENNCMASTASAAGYSTGATLVSAFAAYLMITGHHLPFWTTVGLVFFLGMLGVFMAIPMKRNMVNVEQLPFPTGTAAAETLRSLYAEGKEAGRKATGLFSAMGFGSVLAWVRDAGIPFRQAGKLKLWTIPGYLPLKALFERLGFPGAALLADPQGFTLTVEASTIMMAAGALMGLRVAGSMALGAVINYGLLAPTLHERGVIIKLGFRGIVSWSVWGGVAIMTSAALLNFFWEWRTIVRAFSGLGGALRRGRAGLDDDPLARIEVPGAWFVAGVTVATAGCVVLERAAFGISMGLGLLAVAVSFILAIVACRATGETDTTPIGALGKITQLLYGALIPQNITANLMTANITSSVASSSADLLTDLKSGYLLGANPRKQFLAQFFGVFIGAVCATGTFYLLVPTPGVIGGDKFPAPAAQVWKAVAELLAKGIHALPPYALASMLIGLGVGASITLVEKLVPRARRFTPSPTGLGLAFVIQGYSALGMFLGALAAALYTRARPKAAGTYVVPVASGLIAGESLMGIVVAVLMAMGIVGS